MTEFKIKIASYDTNPSSTLRFSSLLKYMQEAAREDSDKAGATYSKMRGDGIVFVLVRSSTELLLPVYCGELIVIRTWQHYVKGMSFYRDYIIERDGVQIGGARTQWVLIDYNSRVLKRPSALKWQLENDDLSSGVEVKNLHFKPEEADRSVQASVLYSMLDENNHLNNAIYLDFIDDYAKMHGAVKHADLHYVNELRLDEKVTLHYSDKPDGYAVAITNEQGNTAFCAEIGFFEDGKAERKKNNCPE